MKNEHSIDDKNIHESRLRSLLKGLTWRIIATLTTCIIAYFITKQISFAIKIGSIEVVAKLFLYYLHERLWQIVPRGTIRKFIPKI